MRAPEDFSAGPGRLRATPPVGLGRRRLSDQAGQLRPRRAQIDFQRSVDCRSIRSRGVVGGPDEAKPTDSSQLVGSMQEGPSW